MKQIPRISESEWQVMRVLWAMSPATANQVVEALSDASEWKPKTIKTLLNRLVNKKALGFRQTDGRAYEYYPLVEEEQCIRSWRHARGYESYGERLVGRQWRRVGQRIGPRILQVRPGSSGHVFRERGSATRLDANIPDQQSEWAIHDLGGDSELHKR